LIVLNFIFWFCTGKVTVETQVRLSKLKTSSTDTGPLAPSSSPGDSERPLDTNLRLVHSALEKW
jgi:hypothetical protein